MIIIIHIHIYYNYSNLRQLYQNKLICISGKITTSYYIRQFLFTTQGLEIFCIHSYSNSILTSLADAKFN